MSEQPGFFSKLWDVFSMQSKDAASALQNMFDPLLVVGMTILLLVVTLVLWWVRSKMVLDEVNCSNMNTLYDKFPTMSTFNSGSTMNQDARLRDFYIKTAYNCCAAGQFKNDFVNVCALKDNIKQGARALDMAIYVVNGIPAIAVSSQNDVSLKESYNSVPFAKALQVINDYAFAGSTCPNPGDPLILHFRIMSNMRSVYDKIAGMLFNTLQNRLLGRSYSYESRGENFGKVPMRDLMGKVIIIVNKPFADTPTFVGTKLDEYVNMTSNSVFMRCLRYDEVRYSPDTDELTDFNKKRMSIVLPNLSVNAENANPQLPFTYGCQLVAMCMQNMDANLLYYNKLFNDANSAFVLKPQQLRFTPLALEQPADPDPVLSYEERTAEFAPGMGEFKF